MSKDLPVEETSATDQLHQVYALIWRSTATDNEFDQNEFDRRIPRLMEWLKSLHREGKLVGCGGGGFENHMGGLTLIQTESVDEAIEISTQSPMNEIGSTEVLVWDVYYANLSVSRDF